MTKTSYTEGDRVSFRQSDSINRLTAVVESVERCGDGSVYSPFYNVYTVRDERRGWQHRINDLTMDIRPANTDHAAAAGPTTAVSPF